MPTQPWMEAIPIVGGVIRHLRRAVQRRALRRLSRAEIFTRILRENAWGSQQSVSGTGSEVGQTAAVRAALPPLLRELGVTSLLDIPCGDFHWMRQVDLSGIVYLGADIVPELVDRNRQLYARPHVEFRCLDLVCDPLPRVDLVLCRDCLVHLPSAEIWQAFRNLQASGSTYLLTTTFPQHGTNTDIRTGQWRTLNLEQAPFFLPPPLRIIDEQCSEADGRFRDKSLGLWRIADLRACSRAAA